MISEKIENKGVNNIDKGGKISFSERFSYGCGDFASNILYTAMSAFLLYYYTDFVGVSAVAVGTIMLISRLFDGVSDLAMGIIIDKTKSKFGKARVWILRLVVPYAVGTVLLFAVPENWTTTYKLIYIFFSYNIAFTVLFTGINLPYATLTSLMTQDQYERSVLSIFRMILATCGTLFIKTFTLPVVNFFGNDCRAWTYTFMVFGCISIIFFMITFLFTKERVTEDNSNNQVKVPVIQGFKALIKNKYWFIMTLTLVLIFVVMGVSGSAEVYYARDILGDSSLVSKLSIALTVTQITCMLGISVLVKKFGKRNVLSCGSVIMIIGYIIMAIGSTNVTVILGGCVLRGIGNAGISACMFAMVCDTIEYGEWKTGIRTEGLINSAASFGQKIGNGLSQAIFGVILSVGGYVGGVSIQSEGALQAIKFGYIYLPIILTVVQIVLLSFYKLDKEYSGILADLKVRNK